MMTEEQKRIETAALWDTTMILHNIMNVKHLLFGGGL